jgi:UDP-N-acetylglucosamine--N-acetylmuramyl-(pentapeptide) pyrophosphoryl-undecaprenol N-acetylglucosamine transferase
MKELKFIFAGGGTGGHLFPAIAIAQEIKLMLPDSSIMFIGNKNKIEGKVVPKYGFKFNSINISGISRKLSLSLLVLPFKLTMSIIKSILYILRFKPNVVIGTGGYVSGPVLWSASLLRYKIVLQDHNSYPGVTTRLLSSKALEVHIAFEESRKYFKRKNNLKLSGFPVRSSLEKINKLEALQHFGLTNDNKCIFITGGSQGAKAINDSVLKIAECLNADKVQIIWQTGMLQYAQIKRECQKFNNIKIFEFINDMNLAFSACDLAITRAGATTIGELMNLEIPAILIPLPTAAEDHQTKNAKELYNKNAAILVLEKDLNANIKNEIMKLLENESQLELMQDNLKKMKIKNSAKKIAESIINLAKNKERD